VRARIKIIAGIYLLVGAATVLQGVNAVLFTGTTRITPGFSGALITLGLAYGLMTLRPWGRILGVGLAGLLGFCGVVALVPCLGHVLGINKAVGGTIVDWTVTTLFMIALVIAFEAWQWYVLTRPQAVELFTPKQV
jgi:hypothetical protein